MVYLCVHSALQKVAMPSQSKADIRCFHFGVLALVLLLPFPFARLEAGGPVGATFLRFEHNARVKGMGGAFVAVADDGDAVYWNPAGLANIDHLLFSFTHSEGAVDRVRQYVNIAKPLGRAGCIGFDVFYATVRDLVLYDKHGLAAGEIENHDMVGNLGWGWRPISKLAVGAGAKFYQSTIAYASASGFAADAGVLVNELPWDGFSLGLVLQNLGPSITYLSSPDSLPTNIKLGVAQRRGFGSHRATLSLETNRLIASAQPLLLSLGVEYSYRGMGFLRGGYRFNRKLDKIAVGGGLCFRNAAIDYAFLPLGPMGMSHQVSLGYTLRRGKQTREEPAGTEPPDEPSMQKTLPAEGKAELNRMISAAISLHDAGEYEKALEILAEVVEIDPENALAYRIQGNCYYTLGDHDAARQAYERSLQLNPEDTKLRDFLQGLK